MGVIAALEESLDIIEAQGASRGYFLRGDKEGALGNYIEVQVEYFRTIRSALPEQSRAILDIGCGIGVLSALLWEHFGNPTLVVYDRGGHKGTADGGYREQGHYFTCPIERTQSFLESTGVPKEKIVKSAEWPGGVKSLPWSDIDLVVSRRSWGWHYPVSMYADVLERVRAPVILDIRADTGGEKSLSRYFQTVERIAPIANKGHVVYCV